MGNKEIVDLLISKGVYLNQQNVNGNTALMIGKLLFNINSMILSFPLLAFFNDNLNNDVKILIANKLLNASVNVSITNNDDKSALQIGKKYFNSSKIANCNDALKFHFDHIKH